MRDAPAPFSCTFTPDAPGILSALGCSLALTTYQAGKVILLGPSEDGLVQLARDFRRPMGLAVDGGRIAVASEHEVVVLAASVELARGYPRKREVYDVLYVPRATYLTGAVDLHDLAWAGERLLAVNTLFSCLCEIDAAWSFRPLWRPPFVSALVPEDRCHLNGVALADGEPRWATALGATDARGAWRDGKLDGGVLIDVASGEIALGGLAMPHSPRLVDGQLFLLASATGEVLAVDPGAGTREAVNRVPGYARGLARCGDYLFVGHSRIRERHAFGDLPLARESTSAGVVFLHWPTGRIAAAIRYLASCEEIYDVQVLPEVRRPGILGVEGDAHRQGLVTPEGAWWSREADAPAR